MGQKLTDYIPPLTPDLTNKVVLYRRCNRKLKYTKIRE
jgi:hypothetical protein